MLISFARPARPGRRDSERSQRPGRARVRLDRVSSPRTWSTRTVSCWHTMSSLRERAVAVLGAIVAVLVLVVGLVLIWSKGDKSE